MIERRGFGVGRKTPPELRHTRSVAAQQAPVLTLTPAGGCAQEPSTVTADPVTGVVRIAEAVTPSLSSSYYYPVEDAVPAEVEDAIPDGYADAVLEFQATKEPDRRTLLGGTGSALADYSMAYVLDAIGSVRMLGAQPFAYMRGWARSLTADVLADPAIAEALTAKAAEAQLKAAAMTSMYANVVMPPLPGGSPRESTMQTQRDCTYCHGRGKTDERESYLDTEQDYGSSIAMGDALGAGYFPMTRTVTKYRTVSKNCWHCHGTGKVAR